MFYGDFKINQETYMPLEKGKTSKAFSKNVETEMEHGKKQSQAVAIAYSEKNKTAKMPKKKK